MNRSWTSTRRQQVFLGLALILMSACVADAPNGPSVEHSAELEAVAQATVDKGFPGVAIALRSAEGQILEGAAGLADRSADVAMTPDSLIHAASTTKVFTAVAALRLIEQSRLDLDDLISEYVSPPVLEGVPHASQIKVRDLLMHTSGLYSPNNDLGYLARYIGPERVEKPFWTPTEIVRFAAEPGNEPSFVPGGGQSYGDINYVLLGLIIEELSGKTFKTLIREEILTPLELDNTWFLSDHPQRTRARAYTVDSEILREIGLDPALRADEEGLIDTTNAQEQSDAAAGLITTVGDLARFAGAILTGDFLQANSRDLLLAVAELADPGGEEALGILRAYDKPFGKVVTAEGDGPGTNVAWVFDLNSRRVVVVATNTFGRWDESEEILDRVVPAALSATN